MGKYDHLTAKDFIDVFEVLPGGKRRRVRLLRHTPVPATAFMAVRHYGATAHIDGITQREEPVATAAARLRRMSCADLADYLEASARTWADTGPAPSPRRPLDGPGTA